ncbi:hypothetical protein H1R20_g2497, partial [Candolleomyces eurysporus]
MRLLLAKGTPPWATILRTGNGEPAYKIKEIDSSSLTGGSTTAIYKIPLGQGVRVEPDQSQYMAFFLPIIRAKQLTNLTDLVYAFNNSIASTKRMPNLTIAELATVKIRLLHSDEYTVSGQFIKVDNFYKKEGLGRWYGRDRIWTGPDGIRYRWKIKDTKPELYLNDGDKRLVAKFHREHSGFFSTREACPASLEFFGQPTPELIDMIVITFVHLEKRRAEDEEFEKEMLKESLKEGLKEGLSG